jgi:hypothetical protein
MAACANGNPTTDARPFEIVGTNAIPRACEVAWKTMPPQQRTGWTSQGFRAACSDAGEVAQCTDGTIEMDGGTYCSGHGGIAKYLKWIDG